jgi:hypothetical protein
MKRNIHLYLVILLSILTSFTGCEELEELGEPDYITTTVYCRVQTLYRYNDNLHEIPNAIVRVEIIKDGGERVSDLVTTGDWGMGTKVVQGTFNVYNEQQIQCIANVVLESVSDYTDDYTFYSSSVTIPHSEIKQAKTSENTASFEKELKIVGIAISK